MRAHTINIRLNSIDDHIIASVYMLMIIAAKHKRAEIERLTQVDITHMCNALRWPDTGKEVIFICFLQLIKVPQQRTWVRISATLFH